MIQTFTWNELAKVHDYKAIKYGGLKMLLGISAIIALLIAVWKVGFLIYMLCEDSAHPTLYSYMTSLLVGLPILYLARYSTIGAGGTWARSYFDRNVQGYVARFRTHTDRQTLVDSWWAVSDPRMMTLPMEGIYIEFALGGWFKRSRLIDHSNVYRFQDCRIGLRAINYHNGVMFIVLQYKIECLDLIDLESALRVLELIRVECMSTHNLSTAVMYLLRRDLELTVQTARLKAANIQVE